MLGLFLLATYIGQPYLYVANYASHAVNIVDTQTNTIVTTILPGTSNFDVAYSTNGHLYISEYNNTVGVLNLATNTIIATITVGPTPRYMSLTSDQNYLYVSNEGNHTTQYVIDTNKNTVFATFPISIGPQAIRITPDGKYLYTPNYDSGNVNVLDAITYTVLATIPTPSNATPSDIAFTPDGKYAYFTNQHYQVNQIDTSTNTIIATITVNPLLNNQPNGLAITPNGKYLYVSTTATGLVYKIDIPTNTILLTIPVGAGPINILMTSNGKTAYVSNSNSNNISIINLATDTVVATISGGFNLPIGMSLTQVPPPTSPSGYQSKASFLSDTDRVNFLSWSAPTGVGPQPDSYSIYRDLALTQLVANVPANGPLTFADHNRKRGVTYTYYIVSMTGDGSVSLPTKYTLNP